MSKHVIDLRPECKLVQQICESDGAFGVSTRSIQSLKKLDIDYINEHFGSLLQDRYDQGYKDGCNVTETQAHDDAYQRGLDDAWEAARKIVEMADPPYWGVFNEYKNDLFGKISASEAIAKLKAYEEKQKADNTIKVGDIITDGKINYLVIDITDKSYITLQGTDFEPAYIGRDYIKSYHNLHDSKDVQKIAEEINKAARRWNGVTE